MRFSYSAVWDDAAAMLRSHGSLIAALAGVFLFLPALLLGYFGPRPEGVAPGHIFEAMSTYLAANWPWLLLSRIVEMLGGIAILQLLLGPRGTSVGGAIAAAFLLIPFYLLTFILANVAMSIGFLALIVPGIYLMGRLAPVGPVIVAEGRRNPLDALGRTFELTNRRGWAVAGLVLLVGIAAAVAMLVANMLFGVLFVALGGRTLGSLLAQIVGAATGAAFATILLVLYAAIYRALSSQGAVAAFE